ncbi:hypothetical protein [Nakamurella lactea]|uniref:hypothetical protein n=1 Tax=Nakamurella lactea TaxID=459515 RepID=UPI0003FA9E61|nr:hypothetical protein [Nakamurella lactea]
MSGLIDQDWRRRVRAWRRPDAEHPAAADGERLHSGLIAQPVNTASSLAYPIGAWWLRQRMTRSRQRSPALSALAAAMTANGLGSMGFHGPGDRISHRLHDASLLAIVGLLTGDLAVTAVREPRSLRRRIAPLAMLGAGAVLNRLSRTGGPWHRPDALLQGHAAWHLLSATALAVWPLPIRAAAAGRLDHR